MTSAHLGYTVPFTLVHTVKYRREDILKIQTIEKLYTTQKKANNTKHSKTKLPQFSHFLRHSDRKRDELIYNAPGRISSSRFLSEYRKKRLNQASFVLLCFVLFAFSRLSLVFVVCLFLICFLSRIFQRSVT